MAKQDKKTQALEVVADANIEHERISEAVLGEVSQVPHTRSQFTRLMLKNANYFGTMPNSGLQAVETVSGNTTYESLRCIGLNPQQDKLEAVIDINRQYGYNGNACSTGSTEYVRFFVERGGTWHDLGTATVNVHDLPGSAMPISYSVGIDMAELRRRCSSQQLVRVRGILSWNHEPHAGDPNFTPVWGNVRDVTVQIEPRRIYKLKDALEEEFVTINPEILAGLNLEQPLTVSEAMPHSYAQLKQMYAKEEVPPHRYGFTEAQKALMQPLNSALLSPLKPGEIQLGGKTTIDPNELVKIIGLIEAENGNTTYEQLTCAGYNPQTNTMSAVISQKRSSGFSGSLCGPGSTEYVGFWVYYHHAWQWLGNAQVQVHDLTGVDLHHQVEYAVFRPVNMPSHLCANLEGLPLRAILSWNTPPTGPNYIPTWGNIVNTHVQPRIGEGGDDGEKQLNLEKVGGILISNISNTTGRTTAGDRPFGGYVEITGFFTNAPNIFDPDSGHISGGEPPLRYQVRYNKVGDTPTLLTNSFYANVTPAHGVQHLTDTYFNQPIISGPQPGITGFSYTYMQSMNQAVENSKLAEWYAGSLAEGEYEIQVQGYVWNGTTYIGEPHNLVTKKVYIYNGYPHIEPIVGGTSTFLRPQLDLHIGTIANPGDCNDETQGATITGVYTIIDRFPSTHGFVLRPSTIGGVVQPNTVTDNGFSSVVNGATPTDVGTTTINGTWELDTAGMRTCGYTVTLGADDRAIVNSVPSNGGHYNEFSVGFCLRAPGQGGC